jgi:Rod binding domain-containing protein
LRNSAITSSIPQLLNSFSNERVLVEANVKPVQQADCSRELEIQKKRLRENCREFESVMISYMMKTMRDGLIRGEEPGNAREIYEDMLAGQVSKEIGRNSALGIGDMLYSKLEHLVKAPAVPDTKVIPDGAQTAVSAPPDKKPGSG